MTKPYKLLVLMAETDIRLMLMYDETLHLLVLMAKTDIRLMLMYDETLQTVSFDGRDRHITNVNV